MRDFFPLDGLTVPEFPSLSNEETTVVQLCNAGEPAQAERRQEVHAFQERFGRYLLQERLGSGGMAEVWKAVAEGAQGFRRVFVIKRILPAFASSPYFVSLFADEAKLSAMLHHPNLVQVYEFGVVAGIHYLSMDYLAGMDLASVLKQLSRRGERMQPSTAAFVAQQIAHGLAYAHTVCDSDGRPLHLVHRDVSPENVMLLDAGTVKLFDFGIALSDQRLASSITQGKVLKGKLGYTSPEQVTGRPLDGRSDIFSLGVVMWEMLTGRRLFAGENDARTLYNVLELPIVPPSKIAPHVPMAFDAVVLRALARNPADRYPTADHLAEDLDEVLRVVPHHRTDIPRLLEHALGHRSERFAQGTGSGAQPRVELPSSQTAETRGDPLNAHAPSPHAAVFEPADDIDDTCPTHPRIDSQTFVPTQMWQPPRRWTSRLRLLPAPLRGAAALCLALGFVTTLRAVGTSNGAPMPVVHVVRRPAVATNDADKFRTTPARPSVSLEDLRIKELTSSFEEGLRHPSPPPTLKSPENKPQAPAIALTSLSSLPHKPAAPHKAVALREAVHRKAKPQMDLWKHTGDVLDAAHVDPFSQ